MGLSLGHIIILLVILLLFGSKKLPDLGRALGQSIRAFQRGLKGDDEQKKLDEKNKKE